MILMSCMCPFIDGRNIGVIGVEITLNMSRNAVDFTRSIDGRTSCSSNRSRSRPRHRSTRVRHRVMVIPNPATPRTETRLVTGIEEAGAECRPYHEVLMDGTSPALYGNGYLYGHARSGSRRSFSSSIVNNPCADPFCSAAQQLPADAAVYEHCA